MVTTSSKLALGKLIAYGSVPVKQIYLPMVVLVQVTTSNKLIANTNSLPVGQLRIPRSPIPRTILHNFTLAKSFRIKTTESKTIFS